MVTVKQAMQLKCIIATIALQTVLHIHCTSVAQKRQQHMSEPTQVPRRAIAIVGGGAQKQDTPPFSALEGDFTRLAGEEECAA